MKIKVSRLRQVIREVFEEMPKTRRGLGVGDRFAPAADDAITATPTNRGMGLPPPLEDLFSDWDDHVGVDVDFDADSHRCASCGHEMDKGQVACQRCDRDDSAPMTMRSRELGESDEKKKVIVCRFCKAKGKIKNSRNNPMKCTYCHGRGFVDVPQDKKPGLEESDDPNSASDDEGDVVACTECDMPMTECGCPRA